MDIGLYLAWETPGGRIAITHIGSIPTAGLCREAAVVSDAGRGIVFKKQPRNTKQKAKDDFDLPVRWGGIPSSGDSPGTLPLSKGISGPYLGEVGKGRRIERGAVVANEDPVQRLLLARLQGAAHSRRLGPNDLQFYLFD